jgi:nucleoside-diphosphate-sugar epimerase
MNSSADAISESLADRSSERQPVNWGGASAHPNRVLCTGGSGFIGTHFLDFMLGQPLTDILSIDIKKPGSTRHEEVWQMVDILDAASLERVFQAFKPTHLVHLAAKADMTGTSLADYSVNTAGTANVLAAAKRVPALQRVVVASTQHVRRPGSAPASGDEEFEPYEAYGSSKAATENLVREADLKCSWTIVRPTAVWGPGHWGLANGLWRTLARGLYVHPRGDRVIRSYGYVKNVVFQVASILEAPADVVDRRVFYLGDPCINQLTWVNTFAEAITGRSVRTAPQWLLHLMALAGEGGRRIGIPCPLYLSRFRNMVTSNVVPVDDAIEKLGAGPYSLQEGVAETVAWLREEGTI